MTTLLSLYNRALVMLGQTQLASEVEAVESRYLLDGIWDNEGAAIYCLGQGLWTFATIATKIHYDTTIQPAFGKPFAFSKPVDFVRTVAICSDEMFTTPYIGYQDRGHYWLGDMEDLYLAYVSKDSISYGLNLSLWPEAFTRYVEGYLAIGIAAKVLQSEQKVEALEKKVHRLLVDARSKDAMELPTSFPAAGSWVRSRYGRNTGWDRGNPNRLIG